MLNNIKIKNFKSISDLQINFEKKNNIIGKNGTGKTNILEAICVLFGYSREKNIVKFEENNLFIKGDFVNTIHLNSTILFSYSKTDNKKNILLNNKKTSKKNLFKESLKISYFSPISMNLFYLGPKYRRDFLDGIIMSTDEEYSSLLKKYDTILKNRNKLLKNISEKKSTKKEIEFWDESFINLSSLILKKRIKLNHFLNNYFLENKIFSIEKDYKINYIYKTKIDLNNIEDSIRNYLVKNIDRDIIIGKTHIGPHLDDFDILINDHQIINFSSRGELKTIIIHLKLCEIDYIKKELGKNPLLIVDDLSSELDDTNINFLLKKIEDLQLIFTSILPLNQKDLNIINMDKL